LYELSSALYRLAPDGPAREEAWSRLAPLRSGWPEPAPLMVAAALAPGGEGEKAAAALVEWFCRKAARPAGLGSAVQRLFGAAKQLVPTMAEAPLTQPPFPELRLLTSALRCRWALRDVPSLDQASATLGSGFARFLHREVGRSVLAQPWPLDAEHVTGCRRRYQRNGGEWLHLTVLLPELSAYSLAAQVDAYAEAAAFAFPRAALPLAASALISSEDDFWKGHDPWAVSLAARPDVPLRDLLSRLAHGLPKDGGEAAAIVSVLIAGLSDGRLRCREVAEAFGTSLVAREARPRAQVRALRAIAERGPAGVEIASAAVETAIVSGLEALNPGERVLLLEALLEWRSAAGTPVGGGARLALEALAGPKKSTRLASLARQLLELRAGPAAAAAEELFRSHDFRALVEAECRMSG
jgi:hypothetical protein